VCLKSPEGLFSLWQYLAYEPERLARIYFAIKNLKLNIIVGIFFGSGILCGYFVIWTPSASFRVLNIVHFSNL